MSANTISLLKEILNIIDLEILKKKLAELNEEELEQVVGGVIDIGHGDCALVPPQL